MRKHTPSYSGARSTVFWKRVNSIREEQKREAAYSIGVMLQNVESTCLEMIGELSMSPSDGYKPAMVRELLKRKRGPFVKIPSDEAGFMRAILGPAPRKRRSKP